MSKVETLEMKLLWEMWSGGKISFSPKLVKYDFENKGVNSSAGHIFQIPGDYPIQEVSIRVISRSGGIIKKYTCASGLNNWFLIDKVEFSLGSPLNAAQRYVRRAHYQRSRRIVFYTTPWDGASFEMRPFSHLAISWA